MLATLWRGQKWVLGVLALVWGAAINLFLIVNLFCPACVPPMAVLNQIAPWFILISVLVFALAFTLRGSPRLLLWLAPGVVAFVWWYAPAWLPKSSPDTLGIEFTAVTYNVLGFTVDPEDTITVLRDLEADLVGLQEVRSRLAPRLETELSDQYPYQAVNVAPRDGVALLSRFPILDSRFDDLGLEEGRSLRAVVDVDGHPVVVYVVHPLSPLAGRFDIPLREVLYTYDDSPLHPYIERTLDHIQAETLPVLLLCDCNASPRSRQYALLDGALDEAFGARGWGLGLTHPATPFPVFRIDYVWYSPDFAALDAKVWPDSGTSDHLPVWGRLVLRAG